MSVCRLDTPDSPAPARADSHCRAMENSSPRIRRPVVGGRPRVSRARRPWPPGFPAVAGRAFDERFGPVMDPLLAPDGTIWVSALGMHPESRLRMWNVLPNGVPRAAFDRHQGAWAVVGDLLWHLTPNDSWESWNRAAIKETIAVGFLKQDGQVSTLLSDHGTFDFNPQTRNWQWVPRRHPPGCIGGGWMMASAAGGSSRERRACCARTTNGVPEERVPMSCKEAGIRALLADAPRPGCSSGAKAPAASSKSAEVRAAGNSSPRTCRRERCRPSN